MATYFLSFTLEDKKVDERSYDERWTAVYAAVHWVATAHWQETSAFIAFESETSLQDIAKAVKAAIAPKTDTALIRSMDSKSAVIVGKVADQAIFKIMPYLKRG